MSCITENLDIDRQRYGSHVLGIFLKNHLDVWLSDDFRPKKIQLSLHLPMANRRNIGHLAPVLTWYTILLFPDKLIKCYAVPGRYSRQHKHCQQSFKNKNNLQNEIFFNLTEIICWGLLIKFAPDYMYIMFSNHIADLFTSAI